ncbi:hypothetical protein LL06_03800 [Hoeflea sp. BAL378]|uniref:DUF2125 domain-containing protein n=1 Tax=Hoeflea sp. BAL378 TaxID=1547437 RepID=UPI00051311EF|nr:DUF2125 domain-containing protein [Hoeflea sp. BAL378]KGF70668.1 hypothetical protein LL06_03800 [Hoeflea sp. BAL378]
MPTTTSGPSSSPSSRKFGWLAAAIVGGCALWTLGWFLLAAQAERRLPETLARITGTDAAASCERAEVRGYPFRFGLFCQSLSYSNTAEDVSAAAGAFRSAAQFYRPGHVVAEIDGPLTVAAPGLAARIDWQMLQASVLAAPAGLDRGSLDGRTVNVDIDGVGLSRKLAVQAGRITGHGRRNGPDLDIAVYAEELQDTLMAGLAAKAVTLEATLPGQAPLLDVPYTPISGPFEIVLHRLAVELDEASSLEISGPVRIGADRRLSGSLDVTIRNPQRFAALAATADPEIGQLLERFMPLLSSLDTRQDEDGVTLPLTLTDNRISLGMFPLGELPGF